MQIHAVEETKGMARLPAGRQADPPRLSHAGMGVRAGDILLFLTGEQEIEEACRKIRTEIENMGTEVGKVRVP